MNLASFVNRNCEKNNVKKHEINIKLKNTSNDVTTIKCKSLLNRVANPRFNSTIMALLKKPTVYLYNLNNK